MVYTETYVGHYCEAAPTYKVEEEAVSKVLPAELVCEIKEADTIKALLCTHCT